MQQDNARPHTAAVTHNHPAADDINVLDWPALPPEMNPIEQIWCELERRGRENHRFNAICGLSQPFSRNETTFQTPCTVESVL